MEDPVEMAAIAEANQLEPQDLSDEEVARFAIDRHRFPGVEVVAGLSRHYPHGPLTAHVLGYVGRIDERDLQRIDSSNYSGTTHPADTGPEPVPDTGCRITERCRPDVRQALRRSRGD